MTKEELIKNYEDKIIALNNQIREIVGGIKVLEKLLEEQTTPNKEEKKWYFTVALTK